MTRPFVPPVLVALVAAAAVLVGAGPAAAADDAGSPAAGVDTAVLPALARSSLPLITTLTARSCPELPPVWVVAQVQAESGWDPELRAEGPGGVAGLYQIGQQNWLAAGGRAWTTDPPGDGSDVLAADTQLRTVIPWVCANLRAVTAHLAATGKSAAPLDAMLVCHVAGCARVTGSRTGVPVAGEAGCDQRCAQLVRRYVDAVHANVARFTARGADAPPDGSAALGGGLPRNGGSGTAAPPGGGAPGVPGPWNGGATGCRLTDPTSRGCLTGATLHGLRAVGAAFGGFRAGPVVHSTGCWDRHAWNPTSDHATGRACDFMVTTPGTFAAGGDRAAGWRVAGWLRANAAALHIKYLIWQGRYWDPTVRDEPGSWDRRYTGGGIYDVSSATGGHFDHVHASFGE